MKKSRPIKLALLVIYLLLVLLLAVLIIKKVWPRFWENKKMTLKPQTCIAGQLSGIKDKDFVNGLTSTQSFSGQVQNALNNIRGNEADYKLKGLLYSLSTPKPYFYFVSVNLKKTVTTDGINILYSGTEPFAANRGTIEDEQIKLLISPLDAIETSKPILNCYKDYPSNINREVYLYVDNKTKEVAWIITVEDLIQSLPGPNVSHSVRIDAFNGEVLEYK